MSSTTQTEFLQGKITRRLNGLELYLKCPQIEDAMRLVSGGVTRNDRDGNMWEGLKFYNLAMGANGIPTVFPGFSAGRFDLWGTRELILSRAPNLNLSMLLAVGLKDGVTIKIPTVISQSAFDKFVADFKAAVLQFHVDFLKESEKSIRIITEEIS